MMTTTLPVAETFVSIQGEGPCAGQRMYFLRLAGCNVGKYEHPDDAHSICTSALGKEFLCDTNYRKTKDMTLEEIIKEAKAAQVNTILFTGGEPVLHQEKLGLLFQLLKGELRLHLETSGTLPIGLFYDLVTCSPKEGYLPSNCSIIDVFKFVVTDVFELHAVQTFCEANKVDPKSQEIFISPVAPIMFISSEEAQFYFSFANKLTSSPLWQPHWRLNLQQHKLLGVR